MDRTEIRLEVGMLLDRDPPRGDFNEAIDVAASNHQTLFIRDMIEAFPKTAEYDIGGFLVDYVGVEDRPINRLISKKWLLQAIQRAYEPGCMAEGVLIVQGAQGIGKSTLFRELNVQPRFFSDDKIDLENQWAHNALVGKWIVEFAELNSIKKSEVESIKAFLTKRVDDVAPKHKSEKVMYPRTCQFGGSTNSDVFLKDITGNRRFWVVKVPGPIDVKQLKANVENVWANARDVYKALKDSPEFAKEVSFCDPEEQRLLQASQEEFCIDDGHESSVIDAVELWEQFAVPRPTLTQAWFTEKTKIPPAWLQNNLKRVLGRLGFKKVRVGHSNKTEYVREEEPTVDEVAEPVREEKNRKE
jgi:predicted P-loop ATPase